VERPARSLRSSFSPAASTTAKGASTMSSPRRPPPARRPELTVARVLPGPDDPRGNTARDRSADRPRRRAHRVSLPGLFIRTEVLARMKSATAFIFASIFMATFPHHHRFHGLRQRRSFGADDGLASSKSSSPASPRSSIPENPADARRQMDSGARRSRSAQRSPAAATRPSHALHPREPHPRSHEKPSSACSTTMRKFPSASRDHPS